MKKTIAVICCLALVLSLSAASFAAGPGMQQGSQAPSMSRQNFNGQAPQMNGQAPQMSGQSFGGQAPQMNGQSFGGQAPQMNGQSFGGQAPQMSGQSFDGQAPQMNGQSFGGQAPQMSEMGRDDNRGYVDFEALVSDEIISEETLTAIQSYLEENRPEADGKAPDMNGQQPPEKPEGEAPEMNGQQPPEKPEEEDSAESSPVHGILDDLLEEGVITQDEYDAILASLAE